MTTKEVLAETNKRMDAAVKALQEDLSGIRTGRASPHLVDRLEVEYYGNPTPLKEMATISAPEARLITIRPWDPGAMPMIEKAIMASDLGLTPSTDGQVIHLPIPSLTEERREELIKVASRRCEEARISIRNIRRDELHDLEDLDISEDEMYRAKEKIQEITDQHIEMVDELGEQKSAEILEH